MRGLHANLCSCSNEYTRYTTCMDILSVTVVDSYLNTFLVHSKLKQSSTNDRSTKPLHSELLLMASLPVAKLSSEYEEQKVSDNLSETSVVQTKSGENRDSLCQGWALWSSFFCRAQLCHSARHAQAQPRLAEKFLGCSEK